MIEKMKYINITGHLKDIDRVIDKYIMKYDIQLEYTSKELKKIDSLESLVLPNPYTFPLRIAERFAKLIKLPLGNYKQDIEAEKAFANLETAEKFYTARSAEINKLKQKLKRVENILVQIEPFKELAFNVKNLEKFEHIIYQFGRMPLTNFKQYEAFLYDKNDILLVKAKTDKEFVWCVYFTQDINKEAAETTFSSLHFKESPFTYKFEGKSFNGSPHTYFEHLTAKKVELEQAILELETKVIDESKMSTADLAMSYNKIDSLYTAFDLKKYAAHTNGNYYVFVGWMPEAEADKLEKEIDADPEVIFSSDYTMEGIASTPPIKLNNFKLFKPFEFFVKMYGLPAYDEFDPTPIFAITYTLLFGMMFGDLGQGLVLSLIGLYLYKKKGFQLGSIMSIIGVSSMFFGLMYGSVFGFEDVFPPLWISPPHNINYILIFTVGLGVCLIVLAMGINIYNRIKTKQFVELIFDPNGVLGLVFYVSLIAIIVSMLLLNFTVAAWMIAIFIVIPLVLIAFREPIIKLLKKNKGHEKESEHSVGLPMFLLETFIELFEVVLNYFTNSISFVRVGAFALSHAGMMSVVLLLSETANNSHNWLIVVLGNILVMGMEGLVVGIQVLRLQFYEIFSRFFKGDGRQFVSYKNNK